MNTEILSSDDSDRMGATYSVESFSKDRLKSSIGLGEIGIVRLDSLFILECLCSSKKLPSSFNTDVCDPIIDLIGTGLFPSLATKRFICSIIALRSIVTSVEFNSSSRDSIDSDEIKRGGMTSPDLMKLTELIAVRSHNMPRLWGKSITAAIVTQNAISTYAYEGVSMFIL